MLELTNRCNLACTTCPRVYAYGKQMDQGSIKIEQAKKIIDELWPYLDSIGLTGMGETFLYKDIEQIIDYIKLKNKGIIISVSTNAMLPDFLNIVSKLIGKIDTIQISTDGLNDIYEKIRINAKFETLDTNLRELVKLAKNSDTTLMMNMVVTKENYMQMAALVQYAEEIGIQYMDYTKFNLACVTDIDVSYYDFYKSEEFIHALEELEKIKETTKNVTVSNRSFYDKPSFKNCPFPWSHFYICWDGYITPCCAKPFPKEYNYGNVFETSVMDVLNNTKFIAWRKLWRENKAPEFCDKCHFII
jgi:radical SAM protein with 4Fe4S-binding SPASM domain